MTKLISLCTEFNTYSVVIRLLLAAIVGGLIGSERGRHGRAAGFRTHILICVGSALTAITSIYLSQELGYQGDVTRLSAQVISGIGFLGAGTILVKHGSVITGLTTSAGLWTTATVGIAIGYGFYVGVLASTIICLFSITVLNKLEKERKSVRNIYIELDDITKANDIIDDIKNKYDCKITFDITPPKSGYVKNVGIICSYPDRYSEIKCWIKEKYKPAIIVDNISL